MLTGGNVNDRTRLDQVVAGVLVSRPGPGRLAIRAARVIAGKG